jgi:hypothetical protein
MWKQVGESLGTRKRRGTSASIMMARHNAMSRSGKLRTLFPAFGYDVTATLQSSLLYISETSAIQESIQARKFITSVR